MSEPNIFDLQDEQYEKLQRYDEWQDLDDAENALYGFEANPKIRCNDEMDRLVEQAEERIQKAKHLLRAEVANEVLYDAEIEDKARVVGEPD